MITIYKETKSLLWTILSFVLPLTIGFILCFILFGIQGNKWAWTAKDWPSVDAFKRVQHRWTKAGIIVAVIHIAIAIIVML